MEEQAVPSDVLEQLKWQYRRNTVQMLQLSGEMSNIAGQLAELNIRCLFLKGPVLGQELYGDLSQRTSRDLDFLVPMEQLEDAETLLIRLGYEKEDKFESLLGDWKWREHHSTFVHPVSNVNLEPALAVRTGARQRACVRRALASFADQQHLRPECPLSGAGGSVHVPGCTRCQTCLVPAEMAAGYQDAANGTAAARFR